VRVGVGVDVGGFPVQRYSWIRSRLGIDPLKIGESSRKAEAPPLPDVLELMQQPAAIVSEQYLQVIEYVSHTFRLVLFGCRLQLHISDAIAARRLLSLVLPTCPTM
jgi:hypothetical protein